MRYSCRPLEMGNGKSLSLPFPMRTGNPPMGISNRCTTGALLASFDARLPRSATLHLSLTWVSQESKTPRETGGFNPQRSGYCRHHTPGRRAPQHPRKSCINPEAGVFVIMSCPPAPVLEEFLHSLRSLGWGTFQRTHGFLLFNVISPRDHVRALKSDTPPCSTCF